MLQFWLGIFLQTLLHVNDEYKDVQYINLILTQPSSKKCVTVEADMSHEVSKQDQRFEISTARVTVVVWLSV